MARAAPESYLCYLCRSIKQCCINEVMEKYPAWVYIILIIAMVALIFGVDFLFFKNHFWARLLVNVGIVLVFTAFYLRYLK
jgi:hypothetical protein